MTPINTDLIPAINDSFDITLPTAISTEELRERLSSHINHLINDDFEKLVFYLYRIDVDESKVKQLLELKEGENAPRLIADLIIERQIEKIKSRQHSDSYRNRQQDINIDENEKW